jgi:tripartite-type tricarboxylate transporter receptor subunit TctC
MKNAHTVLLTISGNAINATLYTHRNFNFARDLTPVAAIGRTPFVIVVNPAFPVKSVPELIDYAKVNPGKINIASAGPGTGPHVACELFKMMTGIDMVQVNRPPGQRIGCKISHRCLLCDGGFLAKPAAIRSPKAYV